MVERISVSSVLSPQDSGKPLLVVSISVPDDVELSVTVNGVGILLGMEDDSDELEASWRQHQKQTAPVVPGR